MQLHGTKIFPRIAWTAHGGNSLSKGWPQCIGSKGQVNTYHSRGTMMFTLKVIKRGFMNYKTYQIEKHPFIENFYMIKKGGFKIGSANTQEEARKAVNEIVDESNFVHTKD